MPARGACFPSLQLSALVVAACGLALAVPAHAVGTSVPQTLVIPDLGKGVVSLDGPWQFHLGDNPDWAARGYDDSQWEQLSAARPWGAQTHPRYTGFGWYRRTISVTPAPGAAPDFALLIPQIDDAYELYWNGVQVGHLGTLPPHPVLYETVGAQTFGLGPIRTGVLAVRVWKFPLVSNDPGNQGGFESVPVLGSPEGIATAKALLDFNYLRSQQFTFGLTSLYALVSFLSLLAWLRDRDQWLLFWMSSYALMFTVDVLLRNLLLPIPFATSTFLTQTEIGIREASGWFLLIWLLELNRHTTLVRLTRLAAIIGIASAAIDGSLTFLYPDFISQIQMQIADAITTAPAILLEGLPVVLVCYAILKRAHLGLAPWSVAMLAFLNATVYWIQNVFAQGVRFTQFTISNLINTPLFTLVGNRFNIVTILRALLFFAIVYAVIRYTIDTRRRQRTLEQEFHNARELQQVLVPESLPVLPGFSLSSAYRPALEVGGDFFQIIPLPPQQAKDGLVRDPGLSAGSTLVILGDVSGKGLKAAMAVSMIVGAIRTLVDITSSPAEILSGLSRRLYGRLQGGFATAVALRLDRDGSFTIACAGHPAPYVNDKELDLAGSLPLGVLPNESFEETRFQMGERDELALYTDGLLEARRPNGELYSFARLKTLFASHPTAEQAAEAAVNFGQEDDITVLTLTRLAATA